MGSSFTLELSGFPCSRGTWQREISGVYLCQGLPSSAESPKANTGPTDVGQSVKIHIFAWDTLEIQGKLGLGDAVRAIGAAVMWA